ncbi:hypothetical protein BJF79_26300 [Actinomadura sp. CNU-125]|nr:hypothetical protein BJF79_26300 [Actinomadura sp. CNU-125]
MRDDTGRYGLADDPWIRLQDFLLLGTTGGAYVPGRDRLTTDDPREVIDAVRTDGVRAVMFAVESGAARPAIRPALFVLAAAYVHGDRGARQAVRDALPRLARTIDRLDDFIGFVESLGAPTAVTEAWADFGPRLLHDENHRNTEQAREPAAPPDDLVDSMAPDTLVRNLAHLTRHGVLTAKGDATRRAVARLADTRLHPCELYLVLRAYQSGRAQKYWRDPVHDWTPVPALVDALDEAYESSFGRVEPVPGRRLLIVVDGSSRDFGDVHWEGSRIGTPYAVANVLAGIFRRIEGHGVRVVEAGSGFATCEVDPPANPREAVRRSFYFERLDLAHAFAWAREKDLDADGFLILTGHGTWAGQRHLSMALASYRHMVNGSARVVMASLAADTVTDPGDPGVLNAAGVDASLPTLVNGYVHAFPERFPGDRAWKSRPGGSAPTASPG